MPILRLPRPKLDYTCKSLLNKLSTDNVKYYAGCMTTSNPSKPSNNLMIKLVLNSADDSDKAIIDKELALINLTKPEGNNARTLARGIHKMYNDNIYVFLYSLDQPRLDSTYSKIFMETYAESLYDYLNRDASQEINMAEYQRILYKFVYDIGDALVYLHKKRIIHFNVNSKSILIKRIPNQNNQQNSIKLMLSGLGLYKTVGMDDTVDKDELFAAAATSPLHQYFDYLYLNNHGFTVPLVSAKGKPSNPYILLSKHCKEYKKEHWYSTKSYCAEFPDKISYYHDWFGYFCVIYNILSRMYLGRYREFNYEKDSKRIINSAINLNISLFQGHLYTLLKMLVTLDLHVFYYGDNIYSTNNNYAGSIYEALYNFLSTKAGPLVTAEFKLPQDGDDVSTLLYNSGYTVISSNEDMSFTKRVYQHNTYKSDAPTNYNSGQNKLSGNNTNRARFFKSPLQQIISDIYPDNTAGTNNTGTAPPASRKNNAPPASSGNKTLLASRKNTGSVGFNPSRVGGVSYLQPTTRRNSRSGQPAGKKTKNSRFRRVMGGIGTGAGYMLQGAASVMQVLAS